MSLGAGECTSAGRLFQTAGPLTAKLQSNNEADWDSFNSWGVTMMPYSGSEVRN